MFILWSFAMLDFIYFYTLFNCNWTFDIALLLGPTVQLYLQDIFYRPWTYTAFLAIWN